MKDEQNRKNNCRVSNLYRIVTLFDLFNRTKSHLQQFRNFFRVGIFFLIFFYRNGIETENLLLRLDGKWRDGTDFFGRNRFSFCGNQTNFCFCFAGSRRIWTIRRSEWESSQRHSNGSKFFREKMWKK